MIQASQEAAGTESSWYVPYILLFTRQVEGHAEASMKSILPQRSLILRGKGRLSSLAFTLI